MTLNNTRCASALSQWQSQEITLSASLIIIYKREPKCLESKNTIIYRALVFFGFLALSGKWTLPWLLPLFDVLAQGLAIPNSLRLYSSFEESEERSLGKWETVSKTGSKLWLCLCLYGGQTQSGEKLFSWVFLTDSHDKKYRKYNCPNACLRRSKGKII